MRGRRLSQSKKLTHSAVATVKHAPIHSRKYAKFLVGALVLVVLAGAIVLLRDTDPNKATEPKGTDLTVLIDQASPVLTAENTSDLESLVIKIVENKEYETNQDALYVVVSYYIKTSNASKAREFLDKLMLIYDGSKGFSKKLGTTKTVLQLEADVIFLEKQASQFKDGLSAGVGAE